MFKWSSANNSKSSRDREDCVGTFSDEGSYHSILKKATYSTGNTKGKKKKKKKNVDRSVTWSKEFQTYEERCPQSFDTDYDDDDYSYNRDDTFDDEEESLISGYLSEHAGDNTNTKKKAGALSGLFTPIALPANLKMNSAPEDDASLIETMDNYYSGIGKAASEEGSIVSYDGMRDVSRHHRQREIDGNIGNLGLVLPTLDGFLNVLGVTSNSAEDATYISDATSYSSSGSLSSEETEYTAEKKADKSRRTKSTATTKSRDKAGKDIRSSPTEKKVKDTRSAPIEKKVIKDTQSAPTETKVKKKKAKSTAELNVAIQKLETNSSESTDSGIEVSHSSAQDVSLKFSGSDDVIKPLTSDGVLESGNKSGETVNKSSKKKKKMFGLKNKRKGADKPEVDKLKSLEESTKNSVTTKVSPTPDVSDIEVQSLVEAALAQQKINDGSVERIKAEAAKRLKASAAAGVEVIPRAQIPPQIPGGTINQAEAADLKQSFSASTDGGSETSEKKGKVKSTKKKSLKNKLSFRRNKSAFSGRELAFAYAQQQMALPLEVPVEEQEELYVGSSDEVVSVGGEEQKVLSAHSETKSNQQGASFVQEPTRNYHPTVGIGEAMSYETVNTAKVDRYKVPRKKLDAPKMVKKETAPLKKKQEPSAPKPGKEVKKPEEVKRPKEVKKPERKVKVDQPTTEKKKKETAPMKKKEKPSTPKVVKEVKRPQEKPSTHKVAKEVKRPQEKAIVDLPETAPVKKTEPSSKRVKEPTEKFKFDLPLPKQSLYDNILAAESFDSVSTTEDILSELQEIEEAAMLMYQSMVTEGEYE